MKSWDRERGGNPEESDHDERRWAERGKEGPGELGGRRLQRAFGELGFRFVGCELRSGHTGVDIRCKHM